MVQLEGRVIKQSDIIKVEVPTAIRSLVEVNSVAAKIGGRSQFRDTEDRRAKRNRDRNIGQQFLEKYKTKWRAGSQGE